MAGRQQQVVASAVSSPVIGTRKYAAPLRWRPSKEIAGAAHVQARARGDLRRGGGDEQPREEAYPGRRVHAPSPQPSPRAVEEEARGSQAADFSGRRCVTSRRCFNILIAKM